MENANSLLVRLRDRLSEPAMRELTQRLIAVPSENPPGNHYEDCARALLEELDRLGFDGVKKEGALVLLRQLDPVPGLCTLAVITTSFPHKTPISFSHMLKA